MLQVRREAILAKARTAYPQATVDAWADEATTDLAARYLQRIADPACIVLLAESAGEVIGFAIAAPPQGELSAIYVEPNSVGRVGHALLSQLEERAFQTADTLSCVAALNAVPFYAAHGYTDDGRVDYVDGRGDRVPCLRMKKIRPDPNLFRIVPS